MNVAALLAGSGLPAAEARALLAHLLGVPRERLIAHPDLAVDAAIVDQFDALARERRDGVPLAYLLGEREFYGRRFRVTPAVLVPRPETELLVERALACLAGMERPRVLDLGTGSGCIAITLALERPDAEVVAVERSAEALAVACGNASALGAPVCFMHGDWYAPVSGQFHCVVANPPYVAPGDPHLQALRHEPMGALVAQDDGLADLRRIVTGAPAVLHAGGWLAVEHGHDQAAAVRDLFAHAGFTGVSSARDLQGIERVTMGQRLTPRTAVAFHR
jgi:release factor glutamine methyltransferase